MAQYLVVVRSTMDDTPIQLHRTKRDAIKHAKSLKQKDLTRADLAFRGPAKDYGVLKLDRCQTVDIATFVGGRVTRIETVVDNFG